MYIPLTPFLYLKIKTSGIKVKAYCQTEKIVFEFIGFLPKVYILLIYKNMRQEPINMLQILKNINLN